MKCEIYNRNDKNIKYPYLSNGIILILLLMIFSGYIKSQLYNFYIII